MLGTSLVVVHDTLVGGENNDTELTGGENGVGEILELSEGEIETGGDDTALVQAAVQVDDDLASALVIDDHEIIDVAVLLHDLEELDEHLGDGSQDHLTSLIRGEKTNATWWTWRDECVRIHPLSFGSGFGPPVSHSALETSSMKDADYRHACESFTYQNIPQSFLRKRC